jgi:hypothetical protein
MISALPPIDESSNSQAIAPVPPLPELIRDRPNLCGWEADLARLRQPQDPIFLPPTPPPLDRYTAAFAVALHMHQPIIPNPEDGRLISYLQYMFEHPFEGENHRAGTFTYCYSRIANFIIDLVNQGYHPRVMLNYSGTLLWGLRHMGRGDVLDNLSRITRDIPYRPYVEWLGTFWGHSIASTIPAADFRLHIQAWQHHFAGLFGGEALQRVRGFCLPELQLPTQPDTLHTLLQTLQDTGYRWLLATADQLTTPEGHPLPQPHLPHRLVVTNSHGQSMEMTVLVQPAGTNAEGVARMEPYRHAQDLMPQPLGDRTVPPLISQIEDGENTHAMMHDFPAAFRNTWYDLLTDRAIVGLTGSEYLELLQGNGIHPAQYPPCHVVPKPHEPKPDAARLRLHQRFQRTVAASLRPSFDGQALTQTPRYRNALFHYLLCQTSCFHHWGDQPFWNTAGQSLYQTTEALLRQGF